MADLVGITGTETVRSPKHSRRWVKGHDRVWCACARVFVGRAAVHVCTSKSRGKRADRNRSRDLCCDPNQMHGLSPEGHIL